MKIFLKKQQNLRKDLIKVKALTTCLPEAFALVREASKRTRNERHYDVQIIGGVVLHEEKLQK